MAAQNIAKVFIGSFIHSLSFTNPLVIIPLGALFVSTSGKIAHFEKFPTENTKENVEKFTSQLGSKYAFFEAVEKTFLTKNQLIIPGFIDTHIHAPQYPNSGLGLDMPLLPWLETYTFPTECKFSSKEFAEKIYPYVVRRSILNGTTTACYFGSRHVEACKVLVDVMACLGQRGLVGKVCMDINVPDDMKETAEENLKGTREFIEYVKGKYELIRPCITPRFAVSCSTELMKGLGKLEQEFIVPIQSHLSENDDEISFVSSLFPSSEHYTAVYHEHGLLTSQTIMAHCIHLNDDEIELMKKTGAGVAHCPVSNFNLVSGVCRVRELVERGVKVGLATDVSGGHETSMIEVMRQAILTSKVLEMQDFVQTKKIKSKPLTVGEVFHLATMGSANLLGLSNVVGNFEEGKDFDALLIDFTTFEDLNGKQASLEEHVKALQKSHKFISNNIDVWESDTLAQKFERFIYLGDDRNIKNVWVRGKIVKG